MLSKYIPLKYKLKIDPNRTIYYLPLIENNPFDLQLYRMINFTRISNKYLNIKTTNYNGKIHIYMIQTNIKRYGGGMGGLAFAI